MLCHQCGENEATRVEGFCSTDCLREAYDELPPTPELTEDEMERWYQSTLLDQFTTDFNK